MVFQVAQSVPICLALAAAGGAIEVVATAVLAYQDAQEKKGVTWSRTARYAALVANLCLQIVSSLLGNLFATWFGPVSLVGPVFLSAQLLANMIVFGIILGLEMFSKDMKVGTYVVVIAVILLPIVGPTAQENQDVVELLTAWYSLLWAAIQVIGMTTSFVLMLVLDVSKLKEWQAIAILLSARASAFAVNLTVSKVMVMDVDSTILVTLLFLKIISGGIITYALVIQSTAVTQAKFVPLNASALIVVNALTGMIIWEDWRVVGSWVGYVCVFCQLVLGNYLLLGDVELLSTENSQYGRAKSVHFLSIIEERQIEEAASQFEEPALDNNSKYVPLEQTPAESTQRRRQRWNSTAQEAWSSVYGLDRNGGQRRRRTIFVMDPKELSDLERLT